MHYADCTQYAKKILYFCVNKIYANKIAYAKKTCDNPGLLTPVCDLDEALVVGELLSQLLRLFHQVQSQKGADETASPSAELLVQAFFPFLRDGSQMVLLFGEEKVRQKEQVLIYGAGHVLAREVELKGNL